MNETPETMSVNKNQLPELPLFIEDGWTIKATIDPEPGVHPGLVFHYRPMTWVERRKLAREQEAEKDEDKRDLIRAKQMAKRIIDWSVGDVTAERVGQLGPIFIRLEAILYGVGQADSIEVERKNS